MRKFTKPADKGDSIKQIHNAAAYHMYLAVMLAIHLMPQTGSHTLQIIMIATASHRRNPHIPTTPPQKNESCSS